MHTLLQQIETHLRRTGMPPTRFGREVARDPRLIHDMKCGRELGRALSDRVRAYLGSGQ
jgi:hypothetical protein